MPFWLSKENKCTKTVNLTEEEKDSFADKMETSVLQRLQRNQKTEPEEKCQNTCVQMKIHVRSKGKTVEADSSLSKLLIFSTSMPARCYKLVWFESESHHVILKMIPQLNINLQNVNSLIQSTFYHIFDYVPPSDVIVIFVILLSLWYFIWYFL